MADPVETAVVEFRLCRALRKRRMDLKLTQAEIADRCGQFSEWYSLRERGARKVLAVDLPFIAAALECDPALLLGDLLIDKGEIP